MTRSPTRPVRSRGLAGLLLALLALTWAAASATAEEDAAEARKRALALQVMEVTGATAYGEHFAQGLVAPLRAHFPTVPEELWAEVEASFDPSQINERLIPIYTSSFDEQELAGLLEFYRSPLGRMMLERMPAVMEESMVAFNRWNLEKVYETIDALKEKGHEPVDLPRLPPRPEAP